MNNFHYAQSLMHTLYGVTMQDEDFEEIGLVAWNHIGNKRTKIKRLRICVKDCDEPILLPCDADMLEAVTTDWEEWKNSDTPYIDGDSAFIENYIEHRKHNRDTLYASGKFIKYELVGNRLYIEHPGPINILYRSVIFDEDGLPELTDKEALAIATFCAYTAKYKEGLSTNNGNIILLANTLKLQWNIQADLARVDYYISQNEWDLVLNSKTDFDRKIHNKSYKMYR